MSPDWDDVSCCPTAALCAVCGCCTAAGAVVLPFDTDCGPICATLCNSCAWQGVVPAPFPSLRAAISAVAAHCGHLGVDFDGNPLQAEPRTERPVEAVDEINEGPRCGEAAEVVDLAAVEADEQLITDLADGAPAPPGDTAAEMLAAWILHIDDGLDQALDDRPGGAR